MKNEDVVRALREHAEWAQANEWETPITLSDDLAAAADLIEKLTDRCARYAEDIAVAQERTRWVPVTERLPEVGRKVLISWTANGEICFDTAFRLIDGWSATHWELSADVTHWIPLPEGPEVE